MDSALEYRIREMMRSNADEELALSKLLVARNSVMTALYDFSDITLLCASSGLRKVWPNFSQMVGYAFRPTLINHSADLMADQAFIQNVRQGKIIGVSGVTDRHISLQTDPAFKHRWSAFFKTYGPHLVAEVSYEVCEQDEQVGVREVFWFSDVVARD